MLYKDQLVDEDFDHVVRHDISKTTFKRTFDKKENFTMYEYAPYVFDDIRRLIGIEREDYQRSVGPEDMLGNLLLGYLDSMQELASEGNSGSLFYLTPDGGYFVKTVKHSEFKVMWRGLRGYHDHLKTNNNSLIYK